MAIQRNEEQKLYFIKTFLCTKICNLNIFTKKYVGVPFSTKVESFYTHILMDNIIKFKKFAHNI
ncbi:hypothetical protein CF067_17805 [Clostridium sporogenes]